MRIGFWFVLPFDRIGAGFLQGYDSAPLVEYLEFLANPPGVAISARTGDAVAVTGDVDLEWRIAKTWTLTVLIIVPDVQCVIPQ
jgi:hypothetical protein